MSASDRDGLPDARRAFRLPRHGAQIDAQVDDELQFHLAGRVDELMAQGRTREEAEAEVRQAARSLLRAPGFSVIAVLTLALGRLLTDADNAPGAEPVVVLGHDFWQRAYGGDASIVDRMVDLEGARVRVVGVAAAGVALPQSAVDVWRPLTMDPVQAAQVNQHTDSGIGGWPTARRPSSCWGSWRPANGASPSSIHAPIRRASRAPPASLRPWSRCTSTWWERR